MPRYFLRRTPLERKLIVLSIVLAVLSLILLIVVGVLNHKCK